MQPVADEFENLRRILALKRYELPPPGFHDRFARQVALRIHDFEHSLDDALFESVLARVPWLRRLWISLETRPVFAGAFGMAVCLLLFSGLAYSYRIEPAQIGYTAAVLPLSDARNQEPAHMAHAPTPDQPLYLVIGTTRHSAALFPPEISALDQHSRFFSRPVLVGRPRRGGRAFAPPLSPLTTPQAAPRPCFRHAIPSA